MEIASKLAVIPNDPILRFALYFEYREIKKKTCIFCANSILAKIFIEISENYIHLKYIRI